MTAAEGCAGGTENTVRVDHVYRSLLLIPQSLEKARMVTESTVVVSSRYSILPVGLDEGGVIKATNRVPRGVLLIEKISTLSAFVPRTCSLCRFVIHL
jgi:hypothetical protein